MISEEQVCTFHRNGWLVVEGVFAPEEADEVARLALETADAMDVEESMEGYLLDRSGSGETAPRKIDSPYLRHPVFRNFALDGRLRDLLRRITGEEPLLKSDQLFMKPPRFGSEKPYHQDNFYFRCTPGGHVITAWIALDDVDEENGCLRYISGSHKKGIIDHVEVPGQPYNLAPPDDLIEWENEASAPVRKGGVVLHHSETLHSSRRNTSDRWRRGYATHWATARVTSETDNLDNAYFRSEDYAENVRAVDRAADQKKDGVAHVGTADRAGLG
jgi:ectoine hydroxylase-related dioxygenase (phytanoyl-CoA dioxygenase family)